MASLQNTRTVFAQLSRENRLTDTDRAIMRAFEQLMDGRPEISDGSVTVVNIAAEAGISRASYYRSPVAAAIKGILAAPATERPEVDELKSEAARLRKELRKLRRQKAEEIGELGQTVAVYANHIQVLTLRNKELEGETAVLRGQIKEATGGAVRPIRPRHEP
ncbi:MAG TPA: hypothetical protein DD420_24820 [Streptomyces sp.]|uniref:hypothetical protein n=1 Tax=Streptomyces TaxID=1883 RepID=UPI000CD5B671|nr:MULTISPECIES: hypothetical protein [Streptomyces]AWL41941.1 hypothetical protein B9S64_30505 [Streptomyces sp. SM18]MCW8216668.1 hypothetical protein [Streptomyces griseolus]HBF83027.1 hypothetical protein [Streptomyces sp.]